MELEDLSMRCFREKQAVEIDKNSVLVQEPELTENTPEDRIKVNPFPFYRLTCPVVIPIIQIYKELALQKKEKEDRANVNAPKDRDYELEHAEAVEKQRLVEKSTEER
jgi:hypothetical protein